MAQKSNYEWIKFETWQNNGGGGYGAWETEFDWPSAGINDFL